MTAAPSSTSAAEFATLGSFRIRYRVSGTGSPLLLCMGLGGNLEMFEPFESQLTDRQTITFDYPGCGQSSDSWLPLGVTDYAMVAQRLLEHLGIQSCDVLGYSFGGFVAQQLAAGASHRVRRVVLAATTAGIPSIPPPNLNPLRLLTPLRYYSKTYYRLAAPRLFGGETARRPELLESESARRHTSPPSVLGYLAQLGAASRYSGVPLVRKIQQPVLVVAGGDDRLVPVANARLLTRLLPNATLVVIPDAGHLLLMDQPQAVAPHVANFLA